MKQSRLPPRNEERQAKSFERDFGGDRWLHWIHSQPCATCGAQPPSLSSHVKSRGASGHAEDQIPQCQACHDEWHAGRLAFVKARGMTLEDMAALATYYVSEWLKHRRLLVAAGILE